MGVSELAMCQSCKADFHKSEVVYLDLTYPKGIILRDGILGKCAIAVRHEELQLEDEDIYDLED